MRQGAVPSALLVAGFFAMTGCGLSRNGELAVGDDAGTGDDLSDAGGLKPPKGHHDGGDDGTDSTGDDATSGDDGGSTESGALCNFNGTWATKITIAVNWVPQGIMGVILAPGNGLIQQWIKSDRVVTGTTTVDTATVCGIELPDFKGTSFVGGETYGVRFPDSLFDMGFVPSFAIPGMLGDSTPRASFSTSAAAVLIGMTLKDAATATWPTPVTTAVDTDDDMEPGVSVGDATGAVPGVPTATYTDIPVDGFKDRSNHLDVVIRQVTQLSGSAGDCDHFSGTVTIPRIPAASTGKYAIDSHVIGCDLTAGGACSQSQIDFVDGTQPVFSPSGSTSFASVRMPGATCAMVRKALP